MWFDRGHSLQPSQRRAFDLMADHYEDVLTGLEPTQMLVHVDGSAGQLR